MSQFSMNKEFNELVKVVLKEVQMLGNSNNRNNNNNNDQTDNKITIEDESARKTFTTETLCSMSNL